MRVIAVIQTRYNSKRLPGKACLELNGLPSIVHIYRRLMSCSQLDGIVVSYGGSTNSRIGQMCLEYGMDSWCGPEGNLIFRHRVAAMNHGAGAIVRVTGDEPLIDPSIVDGMVRFFRAKWPKYDAMTNWSPRTFPDGQDVEVVSMQTVAQLENDLQCPREDWLTYMVKCGKFKVYNYAQDEDHSKVNLCLDTPEDQEKIERILTRLGNDDWNWRHAVEAL